MSWAHITVCGNLGADPTLKIFEDGDVACYFVIYVNRSRDNKEKNLKFRVEVWGNQIDTCMNYLKSGCEATVTGVFEEKTFSNEQGKSITYKVIRFAKILDFKPKLKEKISAQNAAEKKSEKLESSPQKLVMPQNYEVANPHSIQQPSYFCDFMGLMQCIQFFLGIL